MRQRGPSYENSNYRRRWPVLVNVGGSGSGPHEATITIPARWAHFWDNVEDSTNAYDVVPAAADGTTVPTFDLNTGAASIALGLVAEDLEVRLSGLSWAGGTIDAGVLWLYWDRTSASDRSGTPTTSSPLTCNVDVIQPARDERVIQYSPGSVPGPYRKDPDESLRLWFDVTDLMVERVHPSQGTRAGGGVEAMYFEVTNGGTAAGSMKDADAHVYTIDGQGRHLIGCLVVGGSTATTYLAELHLTLTDGRVLKMVASVNVDTRVED